MAGIGLPSTKTGSNLIRSQSMLSSDILPVTEKKDAEAAAASAEIKDRRRWYAVCVGITVFTLYFLAK